MANKIAEKSQPLN